MCDVTTIYSESMAQCVVRRERCWAVIKTLDPEIVLGKGHIADLLFDLSGIDKDKRTFIMSIIGNERDIDKIADALQNQHPRIHLTEQRRPSTTAPRKGKGRGNHSRYKPGSGRGY